MMRAQSIFCFLLLAFAVSNAFAQAQPGPQVILGNPQTRTEWYTFSDAVALAGQFQKKIIVVFRPARNPSDSSFLRAVNSDQRIHDFLRPHFVLVNVTTSFMDYRNHEPASDLLRQKIAGYGADPCLTFFDEHGEMICRYGSAADTERLYELLVYVSSNSYMKQSLADYFDDCKRKASNTPALSWYTYNEGVALAGRNGKHILINAHWYSSPYCLMMKHSTYSDPSIIKFIEAHFVPVQVELVAVTNNQFMEYRGEKMTSYHLLADVLGVKNYPETVFCESDGSRIKNIPGYMKPDVFSFVLKYFADSEYKYESLDAYLKQHGIRESLE